MSGWRTRSKRQQQPAILLEVTQAAPAGHQHRHPGQPGGRRGREVAVQEEGVQHIGLLPAQEPDQPGKGGGVPGGSLLPDGALRTPSGRGARPVPERLFARAAFEHGQHAGVDSPVAQPAGQKDDLLLGSAEPQLPDHAGTPWLARPARPGSLILGGRIAQDTLVTRHTRNLTLSKAKLAAQ